MQKIREITRQAMRHEMTVIDVFLILTQKMFDQMLEKLSEKKIAKSISFEVDFTKILDPIFDKYLYAYKALFSGEVDAKTEDFIRSLRLWGTFSRAFGAVGDAAARGLDELNSQGIDIKPVNIRQLVQHQAKMAGARIDKTLTALRAETYTMLNELIQENNGIIDDVTRETFKKLESQEVATRRKKQIVNEAIQQVVADEGRISRQTAKQRIRDMIADYSTDVELIVQTELSTAYNQAKAEAIKQVFPGQETIVGFVDKQDDRETEECSNWTWDGERRRYYKLSSLKPSGYNLSRPRKQWENSVPPRHFRCRCLMVVVPPGFWINPQTDMLEKHDEPIVVDR